MFAIISGNFRDFTEETHGAYNSEFTRYCLRKVLTYVVDA